MVAILAQVCFLFRPPSSPFVPVSLAFPACTFLLWERGDASPLAGGPRQQAPHFVRPCENEDERVIALFPLLIFSALHLFLYIIFVGFLSCLDFLIDWNNICLRINPKE